MAKQTSEGMNPEFLKIALIGVFGFMFYDKIFGKSKTDKEAESEEKKITDLPNEKNPVSLAYVAKKAPAGYILYRNTKTSPSIPANYLSNAAIEIKNAIGKFTDDEAGIINAIKKAATKFELNLIAKVYSVLYKRDLWFDLKDNLNNKELLQITSYVNKIPEFIKGRIIKK